MKAAPAAKPAANKNSNQWFKYTVSVVLLRMLNNKPDIVHIIKNYYARSEAEARVKAKTFVGFDFPKHSVESVLMVCQGNRHGNPVGATARHSMFRI